MLITNWKTSLFGIAAAALTLFQNGTHWKNVLLASAVALLGLFAKDNNVTGGTVPQATPPKAMPVVQEQIAKAEGVK